MNAIIKNLSPIFPEVIVLKMVTKNPKFIKVVITAFIYFKAHPPAAITNLVGEFACIAFITTFPYIQFDPFTHH